MLYLAMVCESINWAETKLAGLAGGALGSWAEAASSEGSGAELASSAIGSWAEDSPLEGSDESGVTGLSTLQGLKNF